MIRTRLLAAPPAARHGQLVAYIVEHLREALVMDASQELTGRSRFIDLGLDSKRALEFKELLEEELGCSLRTTLIFDYPTPEALAGYILHLAFATDSRESASPTADDDDAAAESDDDDIERRLRQKLEKYDA